MSREGSDAEAGDDLRPLPSSAVEGEGGQAPPQPQPPSASGGKEDEHSVRVAAKRMSFRQSKKQRRQVREEIGWFLFISG